MVIKTAKGVRWQARFFNFYDEGLESGYGSTEAEAIGNLILQYPSRVEVVLERNIQVHQEKNPCAEIELPPTARSGVVVEFGKCHNCHKEGMLYKNPDGHWYCELGCRPPHRHVCSAEVRSDCDGTCK